MPSIQTSIGKSEDPLVWGVIWVYTVCEMNGHGSGSASCFAEMLEKSLL